MTPTPSSDIEILRGVPLEGSTAYTLYFNPADTPANRATQLATFRSFRKYLLTNNSYQRVDNGTLRIAKPYEDVYDCNYLIFNNTGHENKWFYCYLDSCTYINEHTTEIHYSIDVIQTWYFDYRIPACMVEREHSVTDEFGQNIVPEDMTVGEYYGQDYHFYPLDRDDSSTNRFALVIFYVPNEYYFTTDSAHQVVTEHQIGDTTLFTERGFIAGDTFIGYSYIWLSMTLDSSYQSGLTATMFSKAIQKIVKYGGTIVSIQQIPYKMWHNYELYGNLPTGAPIIDTPEISPITHFVDPDGTTYTPKNKKMLSSPFVKIVVQNNEGGSNELNWEMFAGSGSTKKATFILQAVVFPSAEAMLIPQHYRGYNRDISSASVSNNFIQNAWSEDSYAKWWNTNQYSYNTAMQSTAFHSAMNVISSLTGGAYSTSSNMSRMYSGGNSVSQKTQTGARSPGVLGGIHTAAGAVSAGAGIVNAVGNALLDAQHLTDIKSEQKATPDTVHGQLSAQALRIAQNRIGFTVIQMAVTADVARTIDSYFSMFGYAVKRVKNINILDSSIPHRPYWNYIKTVGAVALPRVNHSIPQEDLKAISALYNSGITFWCDVNSVGNYLNDNSPTG